MKGGIKGSGRNMRHKYTLDQLGNRTGISMNQPLNAIPLPPSTSYTHDVDNRLLTAGEISSGYDNNGNLITKTLGSNITNYSWDFNDMLTQVTNNGNTYIYRYDALGNRVAKVVNSVETRYVAGLAETDVSGNITAYYVHGFGLISKITPTNQSYFYHFDGLGSTIAITDASGAIVNKYSYDEFGKVLNQEEAIPNPFKYVGQFGVMDEGNGLLYMRARFYDPEVGRFISKDPIGFAGGLNLYAHVQNNPVNWVDPSGLWTLSVGTTLNAAIGLGGWGGTFVNFGHDPSSNLLSGWSFWITGTAGLGAVFGIGGGLGLTVSGSNAPNVQQLLGGFYEGGTGFGRTGIGYFQSPDGCIKGGSLGMRIRGKMYGGSYVGWSTTSAIIQWVQGQGFSFLQ
jgi:RHS repeat-associated protein